jgi:hypothetical protein
MRVGERLGILDNVINPVGLKVEQLGGLLIVVGALDGKDEVEFNNTLLAK